MVHCPQCRCESIFLLLPMSSNLPSLSYLDSLVPLPPRAPSLGVCHDPTYLCLCNLSPYTTLPLPSPGPQPDLLTREKILVWERHFHVGNASLQEVNYSNASLSVCVYILALVYVYVCVCMYMCICHIFSRYVCGYVQHAHLCANIYTCAYMSTVREGAEELPPTVYTVPTYTPKSFMPPTSFLT